MGKTFRKVVNEQNSHHIKAQAKIATARTGKNHRPNNMFVGFTGKNPRWLTRYEPPIEHSNILTSYEDNGEGE